MLRQLCVIAGLSALCGLGAFWGGQVAYAAVCEAKCREVEFFNTKFSAGDLTGRHHQIDAPCTRIWWTKTPDGNFTGTVETMRKYQRVETGNCANQCFMNGGVWAESTCTDVTLDPVERDIMCYDECRDTHP